MIEAELGNVKHKVRERHNCCVPQCSDVKTADNSLHKFPRDPQIRNKWKYAIKTGKEVSDTMQVCSKHFKPEDFIISLVGKGLRRKLKPYGVPTEHLPIRKHDKVLTSPAKRKINARSDRARKRASWEMPTCSRASADLQANDNLDSSLDGSGMYGLIWERNLTCDKSSDGRAENDEDWENIGERAEPDRALFQEIGVQVNFDKEEQDQGKSEKPAQERISPGFIDSFLASDKKLYSVTGLHSVRLLNSLTQNFEKIAPESSFKKLRLCTRDRIILTMMKLKLAVSFSALAALFDLNEQTVINYFHDTVLVLEKILKCMVTWVSKEDILKNMPKCFTNYKCTPAILDCYELVIGKPKCLKCRVKSFSHYKKNHTDKVLMICTSSGLISHVSPICGGRASDKFVTQISGVYDFCEPMDGLMVDRGFQIDDECDSHLIKLIRPPFLRQRAKLSKAEALEGAKVARARVHVERVIKRVREKAS